MTGQLKTIVGPMYAGKTSELLREILWLSHCNCSVLVIKPDIDTRYSPDHIETHDHRRFPCLSVKTWQDIKLSDLYAYHTVFLDEIQFMDQDKTVAIVTDLLYNNVNVIAAGLNQDSRGVPFETSASLMAMSDEVKLLQAFCAVSGKPATKTQRLEDEGDRIAVGSVGMYEPRCVEHWKPK